MKIRLTAIQLRSELEEFRRTHPDMRAVVVVETDGRLVTFPIRTMPTILGQPDLGRLAQKLGVDQSQIKASYESERDILAVGIGVECEDADAVPPSTWFQSFCAITVRSPDARAMIAEILAARDGELSKWPRSRVSRAWVHACAVWALCWHLGMFKALSSVMKLVERVFTRRA